MIQEAAPGEDDGAQDDAAVFLLAHGRIAGPEMLSTLGVRAVREQTAVGSSLFAQPLMLAPVPLDEPTPQGSVILSGAESQRDSAQSKDPEGAECVTAAQSISTTTPEDRARATIVALESQSKAVPEIAELCDYLSLFRRWYYRPEKQRAGEVLLPNADESWPIRRLLNAAARAVLGPPSPVAPVDREAAKEMKTKILHEGREGVEREVPVLPKRKRSRKSVTPADLAN